MTNLSTTPSPTPANSETSTSTGTFGHKKKVPTAEGRAPSVEPSGNDDSDVYDEILGLFEQIAQRTGHSVNSLILKWVLLHAHTDLVKRRVAYGHMSNAMTACQQAFEEGVNTVIQQVGEPFFGSTSLVIDYGLSGY